MKDPTAQVSVRILDKEYQIACPSHERTDLLDSAEILNSKMREIRDSGRVVGLDRIAVMAALNITNDFLSTDREHQNAALSLVDNNEALKQSTERVDALIQVLKSSNL